MESTVVGIGRADGAAGCGPGLVDVLDDNHGLADGLVVVDEDRDLLVDMVGFQ